MMNALARSLCVAAWLAFLGPLDALDHGMQEAVQPRGARSSSSRCDFSRAHATARRCAPVCWRFRCSTRWPASRPRRPRCWCWRPRTWWSRASSAPPTARGRMASTSAPTLRSPRATPRTCSRSRWCSDGAVAAPCHCCCCWRSWWRLSRVYLDRHYVSDVVVGALIGVAIALLVARWRERRVRWHRPRCTRRRRGPGAGA